MARADGCDLLVEGAGGERHACATRFEAQARAAFIAEALSWVGTPFLDCGDVKGRGGGVDCAMLLVRCAVDTGRLAPFDPRPYSPRWFQHRGEEKFLDWLIRLGAHEVEAPRVGGLAVWRFGRTFAHGGIIANSAEVIHAYAAAGCVLVSRLDEPLLTHLPLSFGPVSRPVKFYDLWGG